MRCTSSPALSKKSAWRSRIRSSGGELIARPRSADKPVLSVAVHHLELRAESEQAFRMADENKSAGIQAAIKLLDQTLLLGLIEIHHDVAAKDDVVEFGQELGLQVMKVKVHQFADALFERVVGANLPIRKPCLPRLRTEGPLSVACDSQSPLALSRRGLLLSPSPANSRNLRRSILQILSSGIAKRRRRIVHSRTPRLIGLGAECDMQCAARAHVLK